MQVVSNNATLRQRDQVRESGLDEDRLDEVISRSQAWFLVQQRPEGFWHAPLEANVSMDAEYVFFNRFMGRRPERQETRVVEHMLATQSDDGGWPLYHGGPGHVSNTIEAYFALKLAGHRAEEEPLRRAREFIMARGGLAKAGVFTRTFLAYFGQFPWSGLPSMPVELVLLPLLVSHQHLRAVELGPRHGRTAHRADGETPVYRDSGRCRRERVVAQAAGIGRPRVSAQPRVVHVAQLLPAPSTARSSCSAAPTGRRCARAPCAAPSSGFYRIKISTAAGAVFSRR